MSFIAKYDENFEEWDYIIGNYKMSILTDRYYYLQNINYKNPLKIALRDPENNYWTKWVEFPGPLINHGNLEPAIDAHRSILPNEIIIESDYPTYEENYDAARLIGKIIEEKGFSPHYYYSGNKSIHIHVFLDWNILNAMYWDKSKKEALELREIINESIYSLEKFKENFMSWLREKMISCWDLNLRKFDRDLIRPTHLIRCELSKNKKGYKTFLGYTYKDMSFVPYICNEENRIYPKLGEIRMSQPHCMPELIEEFYENIRLKEKIRKTRRKSFGNVNVPKGQLRECVKVILSEDFKEVKDGFQRGMFILLNELRRVLGDTQARIIINDWNAKMDFPIKDKEIEYRFKIKSYSLSCKYIHGFLEEIGINVLKKCKGKA